MPEEKEHRPFRELIRHTLVYGSGFVTMAAVSLILTPIYAHKLSPSDFGLLALLLVLYGLMKQVFDLGLMNSVGRFFFDHKDDPTGRGLGEMRVTGLVFLAGWGALLTAALCVPAEAWSRLLTGDADHANLVRIVAVTLYAEALAIVPLTLIRMQERSVLFVAISVARFICTLVLSIVFVAGLDWGVRGALLGNAIPAVAVLLLLIPEYLVALGNRPSREMLGRMLAFGLPFFPVLLAGWLIEASDRYLLDLFRDREEVGWYALAYRISAVMQIAVAAFSMGWAPLRYKIIERKDAPELYARLATYFVLAGSLMVVALAVFARDLVALVAPPSYEPAAEVIPLLALAYVMGGLYILMTTGMGVVKKTVPLAWIAGAGAASEYWAEPRAYPGLGNACGRRDDRCGQCGAVGGTWFYSERVYPVPYDWRRIGLYHGRGVRGCDRRLAGLPAGPVASLGWATACWLLFVLILVKSGAVTPAELERLRRAPAILRRRLRERATVG